MVVDPLGLERCHHCAADWLAEHTDLTADTIAAARDRARELRGQLTATQ